jgi:hypothetical protein
VQCVTQAQAIERVRKLRAVRVGRGASAGEAAVAERHARELVRRHGLAVAVAPPAARTQLGLYADVMRATMPAPTGFSGRA